MFKTRRYLNEAVYWLDFLTHRCNVYPDVYLGPFWALLTSISIGDWKTLSLSTKWLGNMHTFAWIMQSIHPYEYSLSIHLLCCPAEPLFLKLFIGRHFRKYAYFRMCSIICLGLQGSTPWCNNQGFILVCVVPGREAWNTLLSHWCLFSCLPHALQLHYTTPLQAPQSGLQWGIYIRHIT